MENEKLGIETILVIPRRPDRFQYKINDGKNHMCTEDSLRKLILPLITGPQLAVFIDMLYRLRIFAVVVVEEVGEIIELKPKDTTELQARAVKSALLDQRKVLKELKTKKKKTVQEKLDDSLGKLHKKVL